MKYYFVKATTGERHTVVAKDEKSLKSILKKSDVEAELYYELKEDTFEDEGFLITDNDKTEVVPEVPVQKQLIKTTVKLDDRKFGVISDKKLEKEGLITNNEKEIAQKILNDLEGTLVLRATSILEFCLKAVQYTKFINH